MKALRLVIIFLSLTFSYGISSQTVYTTKTGEKYHKSSCNYLKYSKKAISLEKAKSLGYEACKVCKPTAANTKAKPNSLTTKKKTTSTPSKKTTATQCTGKTKAGNRCKRKTKNANGRCYQH
tara:strand:- start:10815 stop:11180 length:366 start_codon:yes stop_codon:yes gene_type:complete